MRIKFTEGYRGVKTGETYYAPGTVADLEPDVAKHIISLGKAKNAGRAPAPETATADEAKPAPKRRRARRAKTTE